MQLVYRLVSQLSFEVAMRQNNVNYRRSQVQLYVFSYSYNIKARLQLAITKQSHVARLPIFFYIRKGEGPVHQTLPFSRPNTKEKSGLESYAHTRFINLYSYYEPSMYEHTVAVSLYTNRCILIPNDLAYNINFNINSLVT